MPKFHRCPPCVSVVVLVLINNVMFDLRTPQVEQKKWGMRMKGSSTMPQRWHVISATLFAAAALTWVAAVRAQEPPGTWATKAPLPAARGEVAAVALDSKLHALGGSVNGTAGPYHDEYDPAADSWRARAPLPEGRDHLAVAAAGGKIYAFGGFVGSVHKGAGTGAFEYDPKADTWRVLPPVKGPRGSVGAATVDGKIHVIGGRGLDGIV